VLDEMGLHNDAQIVHYAVKHRLVGLGVGRQSVAGRIRPVFTQLARPSRTGDRRQCQRCDAPHAP
jgi:hypothetical protein